MHQSYARCLHVATPSSSYVVVVTFPLISIANSFWATVCKMVCPMLSDRCPVCPVLYVCLSVTLVYCGQMVGWIKMKLAMQVGLGPGHIVLDGDPAPPQSPTIFGPCLLWPNAWMDPYGIGRDVDIGPEDCVRWGPHSPQRGTAPMSIVVKWLDVPRCHLVRR